MYEVPNTCTTRGPMGTIGIVSHSKKKPRPNSEMYRSSTPAMKKHNYCVLWRLCVRL